MKKLFPILLITLLFSCKEKVDKRWSVNYDPTSVDLYMISIDLPKPQKLNQVIDRLNQENQQIQLKLVKVCNDTAYVIIPESEYLTQRCGTAGADSYLATVIYNLSEFDDITYINFEFELGDHAVPGTYSRKDFIRF